LRLLRRQLVHQLGPQVFDHGLPGCRVAVRSANCSCPRVAKTSAAQSTPFARQVAASRAPLLRMRFLWTGYLSARHDFWPRPLSVGTHPTVTTWKANTGKMTRFLRFHRTLRQVRRWSVAMAGRPAGRGKSRPVATHRRVGALTRSAPLGDLCLGIVSGHLEFAL